MRTRLQKREASTSLASHHVNPPMALSLGAKRIKKKMSLRFVIWTLILLQHGAMAFVVGAQSRLKLGTIQMQTQAGQFFPGRQEESSFPTENDTPSLLNPVEASTRHATMVAFIATMCVLLPVALTPVWIMQQMNLLERPRRQALALDITQLCARMALYMMPFCQLSVHSQIRMNDDDKERPVPRLWVCNHTSMLDTFVLLAADSQIRGPRKRPIKTVYVSKVCASFVFA